ncbi:hypothetical protein Micbo1qcDRAFT_165879, partial [Microdochium bolleyi]
MEPAEQGLRRPLEHDLSDDDQHTRKRPARAHNSRKHIPPPPLYKASVTSRAEANNGNPSSATA